jgi:predicted TIM-barrel fold metal-dependent hydrolase
MRHIIDCDVIAGFWPKANIPMRPADISALLSRHGITDAWVCSARGIVFDHAAGNREALRWAEESAEGPVRFHPAGTIDLRRYLGWKEEIREMAKAGIRIWRFFPEHQAWDYDHPGFRRIAGAIEEEGAVLYAKGKPGKIWKALGGSKVKLVMGVHFYDLAEAFALWEEGHDFRITTQALHGPGTIDLVREHWGPERLVFATGAPLFAPGAACAVLEASSLGESDLDLAYSRNLEALLGTKP